MMISIISLKFNQKSKLISGSELFLEFSLMKYFVKNVCGLENGLDMIGKDNG